MKKITVIILMLVYGLSSSGTTVTADYCCGKLSKLDITLSQAENSKQNNQLENKKCCGHKEVNFKLKTDHQSNVYQVIDFSVQAVALPVFFQHKLYPEFTNQNCFPTFKRAAFIFFMRFIY